MLSLPEKNLQLFNRKCSHKARVRVGSAENKKGELSSKGPAIHSNPDKIMQRKGMCTIAILCVRVRVYTMAMVCV